ncbi:hypothetical protein KIW84_030928 [Lathyrus oleraceus]|uniref:Uncharacterized protein n=1 Tax=Pisum sativum TaxID=3888 RepID=A0A9D5AZN2_PEA|nr:hypothetical protein KIW84_030928 [Pisum sativum]
MDPIPPLENYRENEIEDIGDAENEPPIINGPNEEVTDGNRNDGDNEDMVEDYEDEEQVPQELTNDFGAIELLNWSKTHGKVDVCIFHPISQHDVVDVVDVQPLLTYHQHTVVYEIPEIDISDVVDDIPKTNIVEGQHDIPETDIVEGQHDIPETYIA